MAKLSTEARDKLPKKDFAGPDRSFPVEDKIHAAKALQLLPRAEAHGHVTSAEAAKIRAKAHKELGHNQAIGHKLRGREGANESRHGTGGGFFHPNGHAPVTSMPHPNGDGHVTRHSHGGFTHHHADGSVSHHDHQGQWLAAEGGRR